MICSILRREARFLILFYSIFMISSNFFFRLSVEVPLFLLHAPSLYCEEDLPWDP
ncbi:hypothetical protein BDW42DRAFT_176413 [Aspergillus taichungensis]|uniref:Uncharacterized protein n=1 Tax=Aspergillus taichungensis TaxID=482145 RepID=A0A2J5HKL9_9EURO|nr:hypothetical protein BDW42DRAFT_176413 [Aspergillus taichungensis]